MALAQEYGEPLWCKGTGMRNTHLLAVAPTVSNSVICGGIQLVLNLYLLIFTHLMVLKVLLLEKINHYKKLLISKGEDKDKWWDQMLQEDGSAQNLTR